MSDWLYAHRLAATFGCVLVTVLSLTVIADRLHCPGWVTPALSVAAYFIGKWHRAALIDAERGEPAR